MNSTGPASSSAFASDGESLLVRSNLYRERLAEREEILRHKWIESEKIGRDIGFVQAQVSWMLHHRKSWRAARKFLKAGSVREAVRN